LKKKQVTLPSTGGDFSGDYDLVGKILLIGDSGVGKSSLLVRYTEDEFSPHFISTIGVDFKFATLRKGKKIVKLQIWDTAGQERFRAIVQTFFRGAHAIMMCFDLTDYESFSHVENWIKEFRLKYVPEPNREPPIMILIGTKSDLKTRRVVEQDEVDCVVKQFGFWGYYETTSTDPLNKENAIAQCFDAVADEIMKTDGLIMKEENDDKIKLTNEKGTKDRSCFGGLIRKLFG